MAFVNPRKMRISKAAFALLLSGLVLPGLGQIYLKRYLRGIIFMTVVTAGLFVMIAMVSLAALEPLQTLLMKGGDIDLQAVFRLTIRSFLYGPHYNKAILLFVVLSWGFAAVDAYRIGRKEATGTGV